MNISELATEVASKIHSELAQHRLGVTNTMEVSVTSEPLKCGDHHIPINIKATMDEDESLKLVAISVHPDRFNEPQHTHSYGALDGPPKTFHVPTLVILKHIETLSDSLAHIIGEILSKEKERLDSLLTNPGQMDEMIKQLFSEQHKRTLWEYQQTLREYQQQQYNAKQQSQQQQYNYQQSTWLGTSSATTYPVFGDYALQSPAKKSP